MNEEFLNDIAIPNWVLIKNKFLTNQFIKKNVWWVSSEFYVVLWPDISDFLFNSYKFSTENGLMSVS